ncbi:chemotaxis protein CheW [Chitinivibrio alkaliphilus]|uniref:Chemotaxis protein CheW n=1 Tax=Chitinivibrio alkaliphilus ACht1 TaxID=1313304 RepID=U7DB95_9BACT|nr:chemotaxis protein CheW [Chitinivibrio alkaliphilus]ERP31695.1 Chemotaxis protein CheW [Chitinivibrio alkaliphilus ACht1]
MPEDAQRVDSEIGEKLAGKYLTFHLGDESYGLGILKVQQIIHMQDITAVPKTPDFIAGVINLRGKVIPVVELRRKFDMETIAYTDDTVIIVVQVEREEDTLIMGVIVDGVREVLEVSSDHIEKTPAFGTAVDTAFILGVAKLQEKVVMLLDIDKVLSSKEIETVSNITE